MSNPFDVGNLIFLPNVPVRSKWWDEPCTKSQRQEIDFLRLDFRHDYPKLLAVIKDLVGVELKEHGRLTKREASMVIQYYRGLKNR